MISSETKVTSSTTIMILAVWLLVVSMIGNGNSANILCVAPFPALSHFQMLDKLLVNLAHRGHNVTVLSHFPRSDKIDNYTDVDLRGIFPAFELDFSSWSFIDDMTDLFVFGFENCERFASSPKVQAFLNAEQNFDVIVIEAFDSDCYLGFAAKYKAPIIIYSAMVLPAWQSDWIYNPTEPGYIPDVLCRLAGRMNFFERLQNLACHVFLRGLNWFYNVRRTLEVIKEHFHLDDSIDLSDLKRNVSLILVNSFSGISGVRPYLPNIVEIGGIHINPPKPLSQNIDKFLNESHDGVIVISMGSIIKSHTLDPEVKKGLLSAVSKLKERILWKWEVDLTEKPGNVMTVPWLPLSDVLGHPNVKLFVSHGGIHSLFEAVHHGVPIVGIPLFGDQIANLKSLELQGIAAVLNFDDLSEETIYSVINKVLRNESYNYNSKRLSRIFRDQPQTPLEKAIFWTEYVIRHEGACHFQTGALELSWLQYAFFDMFLPCFSVFIPLIVVFHYSHKFLKII